MITPPKSIVASASEMRANLSTRFTTVAWVAAVPIATNLQVLNAYQSQLTKIRETSRFLYRMSQKGGLYDNTPCTATTTRRDQSWCNRSQFIVVRLLWRFQTPGHCSRLISISVQVHHVHYPESIPYLLKWEVGKSKKSTFAYTPDQSFLPWVSHCVHQQTCRLGWIELQHQAKLHWSRANEPVLHIRAQFSTSRLHKMYLHYHRAPPHRCINKDKQKKLQHQTLEH